MLGFEFDKNFDYPYVSRSVTEFWRRWHISLGTWFREYLYIPLGGNRVGKWRHFLNIFIVWFCTGFWHGAGWNFILWGLYFGVLLVVEKTFLLGILKKLPRWVGHVYTLLAVLFSWVFFAIEDMSVVGRYFGNMFGFGGLPFINGRGVYLLYTNVILLVALFLCATPLFENLKNRLAQKNRKVFTVATLVGCIAVWLVATSYMVSSSYNPFLYFRF
jgi:alginate O-acetyltransferase complex protein AlgI